MITYLRFDFEILLQLAAFKTTSSQLGVQFGCEMCLEFFKLWRKIETGEMKVNGYA